jgi:hypothetical protein
VGGHAAPRGGDERRGDGAAGVVVGEDVGLDEDLAPRRLDRRDERREIRSTAAQQRQTVAVRVRQEPASAVRTRRVVR